MSDARFLSVLFDFDGTLTHPDALDFPALRAAIGCPPGSLILEYIDALPTEEERGKKRLILADFEMAAARASVPNHGAEKTVRLIRRHGMAIGILTRNTRTSIMESLKNFSTVSARDFQVIITRENSGRPKPHPDGVLMAAQQLGVAPRQMLLVGDFVFDIAAGKAAGASTALLTNGGRTPPMRLSGNPMLSEPVPDFTIASLEELAVILGL
jgi:HAD superfamily hydrolase (TIGR01509 family)